MLVDKKGIDPVVLDVEKISDVTDYYVICSSESQRGVKTLADYVEKFLKDSEVPVLGVEGYGTKEWVLIDTPDVVIHIFYKPAREYYDLEGLWYDSPRIDIASQNGAAMSGE